MRAASQQRKSYLNNRLTFRILPEVQAESAYAEAFPGGVRIFCFFVNMWDGTPVKPGFAGGQQCKMRPVPIRLLRPEETDNTGLLLRWHIRSPEQTPKM